MDADGLIVILDEDKVSRCLLAKRDNVYFGGFSDSSKASNSAGSSSNLNACWLWLAEKAMSLEY